jgi:predicted nucleic acid-binding protein
MTPQIFFSSFFAYEYQKYAEFYADYKSMEIISPEKVVCQILLHDSSIEEVRFPFCTLFLLITFLVANFSHFSQQF